MSPHTVFYMRLVLLSVFLVLFALVMACTDPTGAPSPLDRLDARIRGFRECLGLPYRCYPGEYFNPVQPRDVASVPWNTWFSAEAVGDFADWVWWAVEWPSCRQQQENCSSTGKMRGDRREGVVYDIPVLFAGPDTVWLIFAAQLEGRIREDTVMFPPPDSIPGPPPEG